VSLRKDFDKERMDYYFYTKIRGRDVVWSERLSSRQRRIGWG